MKGEHYATGAVRFCIHRYNFQGILGWQVLFPHTDAICGICSSTTPLAKSCGEKASAGIWKGLRLPGDAASRCDQRWSGKCQRAEAWTPKQVSTGKGFPSPSDPHGGVLSPSQIHNTPQVLEDQWVPTLGCHLCPGVCPMS